MKYLVPLALGLILGGAITLTYEDAVATEESPELDFGELVFREGIAYAVSPAPSTPKDEPFTGRAVQFYENGQLRLSGEFVDGKPEGDWELWHDNQTLWVTSSLSADGFFPERDYCEFLVTDKGRVCLANFNGLARNAYSQWYSNGQLREETNYQAGKREGLSREWYENGQLELEGNFQAGKLEGLFRIWDENGQLTFEGTYEAGELVEGGPVE